MRVMMYIIHRCLESSSSVVGCWSCLTVLVVLSRQQENLGIFFYVDFFRRRDDCDEA